MKKTTTLNIDLPPLHAMQMKVLKSKRRFKVVACGRRFGKTLYGTVEAVRIALLGGRVWWVAPTYSNANEGWLYLRQMAAQMPSHILKSERMVELPSGGSVSIKTALEPDNLRGAGLNHVVIDEAAYAEDVLWPYVLRPALTDRGGSATFLSTPHGKNWFWKLYELGQSGDSDWGSWHAPTWDNPYISAEEIAAIRADTPEDVFRQEYGAEFLSYAGQIYPEFGQAHVLAATPTRSWREVIVGVDWGFANPGVMLVCGLDGDGTLYVLHEEYRKKTPIDEWVNVARQLRERWGVVRFICDPSNPDNIRRLRDGGLVAEPADNAVQAGITAVRARITPRPRLYVAQAAANLRREFELYAWSQGRAGMRDEPIKANDHALDALRYAVMYFDKAQKSTAVTVRSWV